MTSNFNPVIHEYKTILILLANNSLLQNLFSKYESVWPAKLGIACLVATDSRKRPKKKKSIVIW